MKNQHFCTPLKMDAVRNGREFDSIRTGWICEHYPGDIIGIKLRDGDGVDQFFCYARVESVQAVQYKDIPKTPQNLEEINRYKRKFHPEHFFFHYTYMKLDEEDLDPYELRALRK